MRSESFQHEDFNIVSAVNSALGVAFALSGRLARGVRFIKRAITRGEESGYLTSAAYGRLTLAEVHVALVYRTDHGAGFRHVLRNLPFLVRAIILAPRIAEALLRAVETGAEFDAKGIVSLKSVWTAACSQRGKSG